MPTPSIVCKPSREDYCQWVHATRILRKVKSRYLYFFIVCAVFSVIFISAYIHRHTGFNLAAMVAFLAIAFYQLYLLYALKSRVRKSYDSTTKAYRITLAEQHLEVLGNNNLRRIAYDNISRVYSIPGNTIVEFVDRSVKKLRSVLVPDSSFKNDQDKTAFFAALTQKQA